jgi:hypothetical protein
MPATQTPVQPFVRWEPPQPPNINTSTNGRRVEAIVRHQRITPLIAASGSGTSVRGRAQRTKGGAPVRTRVNANDLLQNYKFDIGILGNPVRCLSGHGSHSLLTCAIS